MEDIFVSDLGRIVTGKTPRTNISENYGGDIPFLTPTDNLTPKNCEKTLGTLTEKGLKEVKNCLLPAKSICVSCIGSDMGRVIMTTKETVTNQQFNSIIPSGQYDPDYIYYLMVKLGRDMKYKYGKSSTAVPIVSKSMFSQFKVSVLSDKSQQSLVAKLLTTIDDKISLNTRMNAEVEEMAKQLYDYWFVQFDFPDVNGKPYKSSGGKMVWNEKLKREIPEGWDVKSLGDIISKIDSGKRPTGGIDKSLKTGIPSLGAECIDELGVFDFSSTPYISNQYRSKLTSGRIEDNDILIYKDGAYVGKTTLFRDQFPYEEAFVNEHVFLIRANNIELEEYLLFTLKSETYFQIMQALGKAKAAQPGLNQQDLKQISVLIPDGIIALKYNVIVDNLFKSLFANAKQIARLINMRDELLPMLMNGQVTIE